MKTGFDYNKIKLKIISKIIWWINILMYPSHTYAYFKFKKYTLTNWRTFVANTTLAIKYKNIEGAVVECGAWKGGMIAGIAYLFCDKREYFLFDSFEGLPPAKKNEDGSDAILFHKNNNLSVDISFAQIAMIKSGTSNYNITKGWFKDTLPSFSNSTKIAILRLDGDWYESTLECLNILYEKVVGGGIIIIDDYYAWIGCSKAVHDFLSSNKLSDKIFQWDNNVCYIIKGNICD